MKIEIIIFDLNENIFFAVMKKKDQIKKYFTKSAKHLIAQKD